MPHAITILVRYAECDAMGIAHHASYLPWLEVGRTELLKAAGRSYRAIEAAGLFLPLASLSVEYLRPVRYDDALRIATRLTGLSPVRTEFHYEVFGPDGARATRAATRHAVTGRDGRITRLPPDLHAALKPLLEPTA